MSFQRVANALSVASAPGRRTALALALLGSPAILGTSHAADPAATAPGETRDALTLQAARNAAVAARGKKAYYPPKFDLSGLPSYAPKEKLSSKASPKAMTDLVVTLKPLVNLENAKAREGGTNAPLSEGYVLYVGVRYRRTPRQIL